MDKSMWASRIKDQCMDADTYETRLDDVIDTLAQILADRDATREQYERDGGQPTLIHVNRAGEANVAKNPALMLIMDLNTQALAYWRELGLTVKAYKQLGKAETQQKAVLGLESLLAGLSDGKEA